MLMVKNEGIFIKYQFAACIGILFILKTKTLEMMKEYGVIAISTEP